MKRLTRTLIGAAVAATAMLSMAGCTAAPTEGVVVNKTYAEAHDEPYTVSVDTYEYGCHYRNIYTASGDYDYKHVCEFYHGDHGKTEERIRHIPDKWTILFKGMNSKDKMVERTIDVSKSQYEQANPGYSIKLEDGNVFLKSR
jgi:hypothetical protein